MKLEEGAGAPGGGAFRGGLPSSLLLSSTVRSQGGGGVWSKGLTWLSWLWKGGCFEQCLLLNRSVGVPVTQKTPSDGRQKPGFSKAFLGQLVVLFPHAWVTSGPLPSLHIRSVDHAQISDKCMSPKATFTGFLAHSGVWGDWQAGKHRRRHMCVCGGGGWRQ